MKSRLLQKKEESYRSSRWKKNKTHKPPQTSAEAPACRKDEGEQMAPAFTLPLRHYVPKRCHTQTSLLHPGCWVAELPHRNTLPFQRQGCTSSGKGKLAAVHPAAPLLREHPMGRKTKPFLHFLSEHALLGKAMLHSCRRTGIWPLCRGRWTYCTSHAQKVILNLARKNLEDHEAPTGQHKVLPCSRHKQFRRGGGIKD